MEKMEGGAQEGLHMMARAEGAALWSRTRRRSDDSIGSKSALEVLCAEKYMSVTMVRCALSRVPYNITYSIKYNVR